MIVDDVHLLNRRVSIYHQVEPEIKDAVFEDMPLTEQDAVWVEARLRTPFTWRGTGTIRAVEAVDGQNMTMLLEVITSADPAQCPGDLCWFRTSDAGNFRVSLTDHPKAQKKGAKKRKPTPAATPCSHYLCARMATQRVMVSRSAHESARYADLCSKHAKAASVE